MYRWQVAIYNDYATVRTTTKVAGRMYSLSLKQFLMGPVPAGYNVIDHINRDPLDNGWWNLRFATYATNAGNVNVRGKIPFYGVREVDGKYVVGLRSKVFAKFDNVLHAAWYYNLLVKNRDLSRPVNDMEEPCDFVLPSTAFTEPISKATTRKPKRGESDPVRDSEGVPVISVGVQFAKVDEEDYQMLSLSVWRLRSDGRYPQTNHPQENSPVTMHQFLMQHHQINVPEGYVIDHINRNGLDNRKINLRIVRWATNCQNATRPVPKSGYIGVTQRGDNYQGRLLDFGKVRYVGTYPAKEIAAHAYNKAVCQIHGPGALVNDVPEPSEYLWNADKFVLEQVTPIVHPDYTRNRNGFKFVDQVKGKFRANIVLAKTSGVLFNGKPYRCVGTFETPEVAAYAVNCFLLKMFPKTAVLNNVTAPEGFTWNDVECTLLPNEAPQLSKPRGTVGYRGVTANQKQKAWMAAAYVEKKRYHLGLYESKELAAVAYNEGMKQLFPGREGMKLNDVPMPAGYVWDPSKMRVVLAPADSQQKATASETKN